jgi:hypothetical protein
MDRLRTMATYGEAVSAFPPEAWDNDPTWMARFLAVVDSEFGGAVSFLAAHGVDADMVRGLRDRMLEKN